MKGSEREGAYRIRRNQAGTFRGHDGAVRQRAVRLRLHEDSEKREPLQLIVYGAPSWKRIQHKIKEDAKASKEPDPKTERIERTR